MDLSPQVRKLVYGQEVRAGLRLPVTSNHDHISFTVTVVCDQVTPERWHGEVLFSGHTLIRTEPVETHEKAGRAAENALRDKIVEVFST